MGKTLMTQACAFFIFRDVALRSIPLAIERGSDERAVLWFFTGVKKACQNPSLMGGEIEKGYTFFASKVANRSL